MGLCTAALNNIGQTRFLFQVLRKINIVENYFIVDKSDVDMVPLLGLCKFNCHHYLLNICRIRITINAVKMTQTNDNDP